MSKPPLLSSATLTVRETAQTIKCTIGHVYNLIWAGKISAERDIKGWKVSTSSVQLYLHNKRG